MMARAFLAVLLAVATCCAAAADATSVSLTVRPAVSDGTYTLQFEMKNQTSSAFKTIAGALPWVDGISGVQMEAFAGDVLDGDTSLHRMRKVGALLHNLEEVAIAPQASVTGEVRLVERFPQFAEVIRKNSIVVFWSYIPLNLDRVPETRLFGVVFFRRRE